MLTTEKGQIQWDELGSSQLKKRYHMVARISKQEKLAFLSGENKKTQSQFSINLFLTSQNDLRL